MRSELTHAEDFLPLTTVVFEILLSLADGDRHGYAVMQSVDERSDGRIKLHAGTLYRALSRLVDSGLIEELEARPESEHDDARRRYYRLTDLGRRTASLEAVRLAGQVAVARRIHLIPEMS